MNVVFAIPSGPQINVNCNSNEKFHDIFPKIIQLFNLENFNHIYFVYQGKKLNENDKIGIIKNTTNNIVFVYADNQKQPINNLNSIQTRILPQENQNLMVTFSLISGKTITFKCNPSESINDVLSKIVKNLEIENCTRFRFIYNGKVLDITKKFEDIGYAIGNMIIVYAN